MSRSYREPWFLDGYGKKSTKFKKREANRRVRNSDNVPNGKSYRKYYDPWNIRDWKYHWDSKPLIWYYGGEQIVNEPMPEWRARRK